MPSPLALIPCYVFAESDFYATEAGREHFANRKRRRPEPRTPCLTADGQLCSCAELKSIRYCVQEVLVRQPELCGPPPFCIRTYSRSLPLQ